MTNYLIMGRFGAPFGIRGDIKVQSHTEPTSAIIDYPWFTQTQQGEYQAIELVRCEAKGAQIIAHIQGFDDRDQVRVFTNREIWVPESALASLDEDEYYWHELKGFEVIDQHEHLLGTVDELFNTGANDILAVKSAKRKQRQLIPFILGDFITHVDRKAKRIVVDWHETEDDA